jgi:glycosyltransferase involved in cell wall biosynthesis
MGSNRDNETGSNNRLDRRVSIIIPCYNEEQTIEATVHRLLSLDHDFDPEVIVVDDGSTDRTRDVLRGLDGIVVLHNGINRGKGASILAAAEKASGEVLVVQDADLEYDPADIPRLVRPILEGRSDAVYGSRFKGKIVGMRVSHYVANKVITYATCLLYSTGLTDVLTGHKAFKAEVFRKLDLHPSRFEFEVEATIRILERGNTIEEIPIAYYARRLGNAKIRWTDGLRCLLYLLKRRVRS